MTDGVPPPGRPVWAPAGALSPARQWLVLAGLSAALAGLLTVLGIPAALLLGPMLAGVLLTAAGGALEVPGIPYALAQGLLGCMIARALPSSILRDVAGHGLLFALGVLSVIGMSGLLGWLMLRLRVLPGTTIVWGISPGAATVMTLMAESFGADAQLVAFMQYLRVLLVAALASLIARIAGVGMAHVSQSVLWFSGAAPLPLAETLALAVAGPLIARRLRITAGALLLPMIGGVVLSHAGLMTIALPRWLLAVGYAFIGWRIGLRFTRELLLHAARALPRIAAATLALIAACGGLAALLTRFAGIDPLTAYLATSPGGADSVAIIAASSHVDKPFVMTMQMLRFVAVLILGPALAKFIAARAASDPPPV
jgi:uncharacterized protein